MHASISRRSFLAAGTLSIGLPRFAYAAGDRRFVFVVLRGALDGLAAVPPVGDRDYERARGALAFAPDALLPLDGFFALNPALPAFHVAWKARELAVFHAIHTAYRQRSHFDAQDLLENGTSAPRGRDDGWLNRALGLMQRAGRDERIGLSTGQTVPLVLRGATPVAAWSPPVLPGLDDDFAVRLAALYAPDPVLGPALVDGLRAKGVALDVLGPGARTDAGGARVRVRFAAIAGAVGKLLADPRGPRVAVLDVGGWDTHAGQGTVAGRLAAALQELDSGIAALKGALGAEWRRTAVLCATEFGRTVAPNGTGGTDHGSAGAAFLLGGAVRGGEVIADWPGMSRTVLLEGRDLAPTADLRAPIKSVLIEHLGLDPTSVERVVFPDSREVARPARALFV